MQATRTQIDRIMARLADGPNGCRVWTGATVNGGYGFVLFEGRQSLAHRVAWTIANGPIPSGMVICHRYFHTRKTHCPQGHPYDDVNTYITPRGFRQCRTCVREAGRRRDARKTPKRLV